MIAVALFALLLAVVQAVALRRHVRRTPAAPRSLPFISVLKPLCGVDDDLWRNLRTFARLDYPRFEIVLGVKDAGDAAFPLALQARRRWPGLVRVALQRGAPGLNPKVNQLITLAQAARGDVLVVSDSNVRVRRDYLKVIAAAFDDARVGLVTHPVAGAGERSAGALFDNTLMCGATTPGIIGAKCVAGRDLVVGKSMALRRGDLRALGGFERLKDVLAEDFLSGRLVTRELGKRVVLASSPVINVVRSQGMGAFFSRYLRWSVMQRKAVGTPAYAAQILLNPVALALAALAASPSAAAGFAFAGVWIARAALHESSARALRGRGLAAFCLLSPAADLLLGAAWAAGLWRDEICWRGNRLRVCAGTRLEPVEPAIAQPDLATLAR